MGNGAPSGTGSRPSDRANKAVSPVPASIPSADDPHRIQLIRLQHGVDLWMDACFGAEIKADVQERCDRFIEEALEFVQAAGYSADRAHALVDYTFGRPEGEINQEVGGVMVTLAAMCNTLGVDIGAAASAELARVWTKIEKIRAKQAAKPTGSALPIASAIEARRAETAQTGSVEDESAVAKPDAQGPQHD